MRSLPILLLVVCCFVWQSSVGAAEPAANAPNLVVNGGLDQADPADARRPLGWERPDGLGVRWEDAPAPAGAGHGKALRLDTAVSEIGMMEQWKKVGITAWNIPNATADPVAATYGLSIYSQAFPITKGRSYRVSVAYHGAGGAKVWVRGYGELTRPEGVEKRRLYEAVAEVTASPQGWTVTAHDFAPTKHTPKVTEMKVMLFAYWPPGVSWFDDVRVVELPEEAQAPAP